MTRTTGICRGLSFGTDFLLELLSFATSGGDSLLNVILLLRHGASGRELWFWEKEREERQGERGERVGLEGD